MGREGWVSYLERGDIDNILFALFVVHLLLDEEVRGEVRGEMGGGRGEVRGLTTRENF